MESQPTPTKRILILAGCLLISLVSPTLRAEDVVIAVSTPAGPVTAGGRASFWVNALNPSAQPAAYSFPSKIPCRPVSQTTAPELIAWPRDTASASTSMVAPGTFVRREFEFAVPLDWSGAVTLELPDFPAARLAFTVQRPPPAASPAAKSWPLVFLSGVSFTGQTNLYDPGDFFKQHIFGYEPMYFIAGTKSPNARFQISFKYRVFNETGWPAAQAPWLTGLHVAYTQTSLWDWNGPSAPFYDTSYKPELLYAWDRALGGEPDDWYRLDLQGGLQHESNGKDGPASRSMNFAYLRPTLMLGKGDGLQFTLKPRVFTYLGDLSDNPDISNYRGYGELRTSLGWKHGLQASAFVRTGKTIRHTSVLADVSYPLMAPPTKSFSAYLYAQYFTGYGESLLGYKQKSDIFRLGFSLYR